MESNLELKDSLDIQTIYLKISLEFPFNRRYDQSKDFFYEDDSYPLGNVENETLKKHIIAQIMWSDQLNFMKWAI